MNFSLVIPTKDRPEDLRECLESVANQTLLPKEVLIVDDGDLSETVVTELRRLIPAGTTMKHIRKSPPDLAESRNLGARKASSERVLFLDDDVILERNYVQEIAAVWESAPEEVVAVGGIIENNRKKGRLERLFDKLFFLSSPLSWDVTGWGFQVWDPFPSKPVRGFYCYGGISSYRRDAILKLPFRSLSPGRTTLEDVDWCLRAKKIGLGTIVTPNAKLFHKSSPVSRDAEFTIGLKEGYNRSLIFATECSPNFFNCFKFWVASAGWILRLLLVGWWPRSLGLIWGRLRFLFPVLR